MRSAAGELQRQSPATAADRSDQARSRAAAPRGADAPRQSRRAAPGRRRGAPRGAADRGRTAAYRQSGGAPRERTRRPRTGMPGGGSPARRTSWPIASTRCSARPSGLALATPRRRARGRRRPRLAKEIARQQIAGRMRDTAKKMREAAEADAAAGRGDEAVAAQGTAEAEQQMARALDQIVDRLGGAAADAHDPRASSISHARSASASIDSNGRFATPMPQRRCSSGQGRSPGRAEGAARRQVPPEGEPSAARGVREGAGRGARFALTSRARLAGLGPRRHLAGRARVERSRQGHGSLQAGLFEVGVAAQGRRLRPRSLRGVDDLAQAARKGVDDRLSAGGSDRVPRRLSTLDRPILRIAGQEEVGRRVLRESSSLVGARPRRGRGRSRRVARIQPTDVAARRRWALVALRFVTLLALVVFLMRPVVRGTDTDARDVVVPILVDTSRSMSIEDAPGGARRIDRARQILRERLCRCSDEQFHVEVLGFGESAVARRARRADRCAAPQRRRGCARRRARSVSGPAHRRHRARFRWRRHERRWRARRRGVAAPIYGIGVGAPRAGQGSRDPRRHRGRGDPRRFARRPGGVGSEPWLRQRALRSAAAREWPADRCETRHAGRRWHARARDLSGLSRPPAPRPSTRSRHRSTADELVPENNARSALVQPPSRPRRVLLVEGAPGFEHGFLKRAWASDRGLESRFGRTQGQERTRRRYVLHPGDAVSRRAASPLDIPHSRGSLSLRRAGVCQRRGPSVLEARSSTLTRSFVGERGGGLLVLGARSFARQGLGGTPLEDVLPLDFTDRGGDVAASVRGSASLEASAPGSAALDSEGAAAKGVNRVSLTAAGASHPVMQLAAGADETRKRWEAVPPLAAIAPVGGPRPGASVLAVTSGPSGSPRALVAVQRFGEGRSMVFYRRGIVAMAHAHAVRRSFVRHVLEAGAAVARAARRRSDAADRDARRRPWRRLFHSASSSGTRASSLSRCRRRRSGHCAGRQGRVAARGAGIQ